MKTKLAELKELMAAGDWNAALRLAAGWPRLGDHKAAITRGHAARVNPEFYRGLGQEPDALVQAGIAALRERYGDTNVGNAESD